LTLVIGYIPRWFTGVTLVVVSLVMHDCNHELLTSVIGCIVV